MRSAVTLPPRTAAEVDDVRAASQVAATSRHPGDLVRLLLGLSVLAITTLAVQRDSLTTFEADAFRLVNDLPREIRPPVVLVMQLGNVLSGVALAGLALVLLRGRRRAAVDLALAGPAAWVAAKVVKDVVQRPRPAGLLREVANVGSPEGLGYVSGHTAVAAALATAMAPYLSRSWRRWVWVLPWLVGLARIYEGAHLPLDVVGGAVLGWSVGALVHLALGAPHRTPSLADARAVLEDAGWRVTGVHRSPGAPSGSFPFIATTAGGAIFVKLLDSEPRDRDWLFRAARFLAFREARDEAAIAGAAEQAHREGAMVLLASNTGARVPRVRAIESSGGQVWIVEDCLAATRLDLLDEPIEDATIEDAWRQLSLLHAARIRHGDLVAGNVLVDGSGRVWLVDFAHASSSARPEDLSKEVAELLVTTACAVGARRSVGAAGRAIGSEALVAALPALQPLALTAETRQRLRADRALLDDLRREVAAAGGTALTEAEAPPRSRLPIAVPVLSVALAVVAVVATGAMADAFDLVRSASARWVGVAAVSAVAARIHLAVGLTAATQPGLALGRTVVAQLTDAADAWFRARSERSRPLLGYLVRSGIRWEPARSALRVVGTARILAWAGVAAVVTAAAVEEGQTLIAPGRTWSAVVTGSLVLLVVQLVARRRDRTRNASRVEPARRALSGLGLLRAPRRGIIVAAAVCEVAGGVLCVVAAEKALGGNAGIAAVAAVYLIVVAVRAALPVCNGTGLVELVGILGLGTIGSPIEVAIGVVVVVSALQSWIPVAAGVALSPWLRARLVV